MDRIAEQMKQGMGRMNFFKGSNRVARCCLVALVMFFGVFASPALADDTVGFWVVLEIFRTFYEEAGHTLSIGSDCVVVARNTFEEGHASSISTLEACLLEKGNSYPLTITRHGAYDQSEDGGYEAWFFSINMDKIVVVDAGILGDHSEDRW